MTHYTYSKTYVHRYVAPVSNQNSRIHNYQMCNTRRTAPLVHTPKTTNQQNPIERFNTMKGYGFIVPDDGSPDVFVHQTEIQAQGFRSLADGEPVEFIPASDNAGRTKATKVTGPGGSEVQGAPFRPPNDDYDDRY